MPLRPRLTLLQLLVTAASALSVCNAMMDAACNEPVVLSEPTGIIQDHHPPFTQYLNDQTCTWTVSVPNATQYRLTFSSFDLEEGYDFVNLFEGSGTSRILLQRIDGNKAPGSLTISSDSFTVVMTTDQSVTRSGFVLTYTTIMSTMPPPPSHMDPACLSTVGWSFPFGIIRDHDPSVDPNYENDQECLWYIAVFNAVKIHIRFLRFDTERQYDYIEIYRGIENFDADLVLTHSGPNVPDDLTIKGNAAMVRFITDASVVSTGFELEYTAEIASPETVMDPACFAVSRLSSYYGTIRDHDHEIWPTYFGNQVCTWIISVPQGLQVSLDFLMFDTEPGVDFVTIYEGEGTEGTQVFRQSGKNPSPVVINGSSATIQFETYGDETFPGFALRYSATTSTLLTRRQEIRDLSDEQILEFRERVAQAYANGEWMRIAADHGTPNFYCPHGLDSFLPWHRRQVRRLEEALGGIKLPYWDWTIEGIPTIFYEATFVGSDGITRENPLLAGPTPDQRTTFRPEWRSAFPHSNLALQIDAALSTSTYRDHRIGVESPHNTVHVRVNGDMASVAYAAYDPIFWVHHCYVDYVWYRWQIDGHIGIDHPNEATETMQDSDGEFFGQEEIDNLSGWRIAPRDRPALLRQKRISPRPSVLTLSNVPMWAEPGRLDVYCAKQYVGNVYMFGMYKNTGAVTDHCLVVPNSIARKYFGNEESFVHSCRVSAYNVAAESKTEAPQGITYSMK